MRFISRFGLAILSIGLCSLSITSAADSKPGEIDINRVRDLYQRDQNGEKLSPEDQAYLDRAKAERQKTRAPATQPANSSGIDWDRAKAIHEKEKQGEKLSAEDQAYLDRAKAAIQAGQGPGREGNQKPANRPDSAANPGAGNNAANPPGIDWDRAKKLYKSEHQGEKLSAEDQAYLDRAKAAMKNGQGPNGAAASAGAANPAANPGKPSVEITPLTDLSKSDRYKDETGGLYGNGENQPPAAQSKLAQAAVAAIKPLDQSGAPSADGKIVLMSIGMSNTTMEFSTFKQIADNDARKAANVVIVDSAQGGKDGAAWANAPANEKVWQTADQRLATAGVSPKQVQIIWIKQAMMGPGRIGEFPKHVDVLKDDVEKTLLLAHERYPNLKLAYLSSRIYAGYAVTQLNPEPYAFEGAFSMRWVIEDQMKPDSPINADPAKGAVKSPVVLWGPYLWADGVKGRKTDSLVWKREDFGQDGTHPSDSGRRKVADLLLNFFTTDETAKGWFVKK